MTETTIHGTGIDWTHHDGYKGETWNPLVAYRRPDGIRGWHCRKVARPGKPSACEYCYAETLNLQQRFRIGTGLPYESSSEMDLTFGLVNEDQPARQTRPRCYFVCSMTDLFGPWWPRDYIDQLVGLMIGESYRHRFLLLTKRPSRMRAHLEPAAPFRTGLPLGNIWLGVTVEHNSVAEFVANEVARMKRLGFVTYLSVEPALGPIDFERLFVLDGEPTIDWLIWGGESGGRHVRPAHPEWARRARDFCCTYGISFFLKQWGSYIEVPEFGGQPDYAITYHGDRHKRWSSFYIDPSAAFVRYAGQTPKAGGDLLDGLRHKEIPTVTTETRTTYEQSPV